MIVLIAGSGSGGSSLAAEDTPSSEVSFEDALDAVCKPGTYRSPNPSSHLPNADTTAWCTSRLTGGAPINIGTYDSTYAAKNDTALPYVGAYATTTLSGGDVAVFMVGKHSRAAAILEPLGDMGFQVRSR
ncbi:hypothetical protein [Gordonia caeni]